MFHIFELDLRILYWYSALWWSLIFLFNRYGFALRLLLMRTEKRILCFVHLISVGQELYLDALLDINLRDFDDAEILLIIFGGRNIDELFWTVEGFQKIVLLFLVLVDELDCLKWKNTYLLGFGSKWLLKRIFLLLVESVLLSRRLCSER